MAHQGQSSEVRNLENGEPDNAGHVHATPTVAGGARKASKVLCLSNGHGEDVIAVRVLNELQVLPLHSSSTVVLYNFCVMTAKLQFVTCLLSVLLYLSILHHRKERSSASKPFLSSVRGMHIRELELQLWDRPGQCPAEASST